MTFQIKHSNNALLPIYVPQLGMSINVTKETVVHLNVNPEHVGYSNQFYTVIQNYLYFVTINISTISKGVTKILNKNK